MILAFPGSKLRMLNVEPLPLGLRQVSARPFAQIIHFRVAGAGLLTFGMQSGSLRAATSARAASATIAPVYDSVGRRARRTRLSHDQVFRSQGIRKTPARVTTPAFAMTSTYAPHCPTTSGMHVSKKARTCGYCG